MRKPLLVTLAALAVAVGTAATWASAGGRQPTATATPMHSMAGMKGMKMEATSPVLATALSKARLATGKYVTNLNAAKAAGYSIITKMIPDMGYHFLNGKITGFDPAKPPILVYEKRASSYRPGFAACAIHGSRYWRYDRGSQVDGNISHAAATTRRGIRGRSSRARRRRSTPTRSRCAYISAPRSLRWLLHLGTRLDASRSPRSSIHTTVTS